MPAKPQPTPKQPFTGYEKFLIFILAFTMFSVILDFMVMSPLGDMMMKSMKLTTRQFGLSVSGYAFSAGLSGLLTAGFADRFDRKKLLLFFYLGFIAGTFFCGMTSTYALLMTARIITGLFGGVIGSISMAIMTDVFPLHQRGRVMGFIQMGFGASQVLGVPIGIALANMRGWQSPFLMVGSISLVVALLIVWKMRPVTAHLAVQKDRSAFSHLWHTVTNANYRIGFTATCLLSIGGFMMMPFGSAFAINNLHITTYQLPLLFMISGLSSLVIMPLIGKMSDKIDKFKIFVAASVWMMIMVLVYTHLGVTPLWIVMIMNILMMMGIMSRMIPSSALMSSVPNIADRGAFMSINSSVQQIAGGIAAAVAGVIVVQKTKTSPLEHYDYLGYVIMGVSVICIILVGRVSRMVKKKIAAEGDVSIESKQAVSEI